MQRRRNSFIFFLAITLIGIYALTRFDNSVVAAQGEVVNLSVTECGEDASGLQISYRPVTYEFTDTNQIAFTLELTLMKAKRSQQYAVLLFFDGVQVEAEGEAIDIECGETIASVYSASYEPNSHPSVVHLVIRELPIITAGIAGLDVNGPHITKLSLVSDTSDRAFVETIHIGDSLSFAESNFSDVMVQTEQREENDLIEHYIYSASEDKPTSVVLLEEDQNLYNFGVRFQNLFDDSDPFTITCLLDDVQKAAFSDKRFWAESLEYAEEVRIQGQVVIEEPGWHQLRCIVLNSLYTEPIDYYGHLIRSTYIYKP